jgi:hypothetical protein
LLICTFGCEVGRTRSRVQRSCDRAQTNSCQHRPYCRKEKIFRSLRKVSMPSGKTFRDLDENGSSPVSEGDPDGTFGRRRVDLC